MELKNKTFRRNQRNSTMTLLRRIRESLLSLGNEGLLDDTDRYFMLRFVYAIEAVEKRVSTHAAREISATKPQSR